MIDRSEIRQAEIQTGRLAREEKEKGQHMTERA